LSPTTFAVIGGGIAGLSAAWELSTSMSMSTSTSTSTSRGEAGDGISRVVVLEADSEVGGKLCTRELWGRPVDLGPDAFVVRRPEGLELCSELGISDELVPPATNVAFVWSRGRLRRLPTRTVLGVPTSLGPLLSSGVCSPAGALRAGLDLLIPRLGPIRLGAAGEGDLAVGELVSRRLGSQVQERLVDPLVGGINAGTTRTMSARAAFPQLLEAAADGGSLMRGLRRTRTSDSASVPSTPVPAGSVFAGLVGGLGHLVDTLRRALRERGVDIRTGARAEVLDLLPGKAPAPPRWRINAGGHLFEADAAVLALPAPEASRLLHRCEPELSEVLSRIAYSSVALVTHRFPAGACDMAARGTGFLVPAREGRLLSACTFMSTKWDRLSRDGDLILRASTGRYGDDRHLHMSDDELVTASVKELSALAGVRADPFESMVTRWPRAFPQYLVGHRELVGRIEERCGNIGSLAIAGAALQGVGIPACIASGRDAARSVVRSPGTGSRPGAPR
jgi:oxygen-dependent protoporphyrinogen oxidase